MVSQKTVRVKEHTRADGTRVEEHDRTIRGRLSDAIRDDEGEVKTWIDVTGKIFAGYLAYRGLNKIGAMAVGGGWNRLPKNLDLLGFRRADTMRIPKNFNPVTSDNTYFTPRAYQHLQGKSYTETLNNVERAIKGLPVEHSFIIDRKGKILAGYRGGLMETPMVVPVHTVGWSSRNMTVTHNHPARAPYSGGDLIGQYQLRIGKMRAVEPDGVVTQMTLNQTRNWAQPNTFVQMQRTTNEQVKTIKNNIGDANLGDTKRVIDGLDGNAEYRRILTEGYQRLQRNTGGVWKYEEFGRIVKSHTDELVIEGTIAKVDDDQRQVFGWASVTKINGEPVVDLQGDYMETSDLETAAYDYVLNSRVGGEMHERVGKSRPKQIGTLIESMVMTPEKIEKMGLPATTPHGWWIGFQVDKGDIGNEAWEGVKKGKYTGFSIHGLGKRKSMDSVSKSVIARSPQEVKGWINRVAEQVGAHPKTFANGLADFVEGREQDITDDEIHDYIMETYGSGEVLAKSVKVAEHTRDGVKVKAHTRGGDSNEDSNAGKLAAAGGIAAGLAALATPAGRKLMARGGGKATQGGSRSVGVGRELPSGPNAGAQNFGSPADFLRGLESNIYPHNPSRMWSAGEQTRRGAQRAAQPVTDTARDVGDFATGVGRGTRAAGQEIGRQGRARRDAFHRMYPEEAFAIESSLRSFGFTGAVGAGVIGADQVARRVHEPYKKEIARQQAERQKMLDERREGRRQRRAETVENIQENFRRRTGRSEGEPARIIARKREIREEIDKHLLGRHEQKDHDPTKGGGHSRSDHTGIFRRDGNALAERRQQRAFDREMEKVAEEAAWQLLMEEVGESEAAHFNVDTRDRYNEIYERVRSELGADDPRPSRGSLAQEIVDKPRQSTERGVDKHLLGRHEQQDHDPTKGKGHSRDQHDKTRQNVGAAIGGVAGLAAGGVLGAGALGLLGSEIGSRTGMNQQRKEAEQQTRLTARDANVQQEIAAGRLPQGSTGNAMDDAMKFGNMNPNEFFNDLGRWAEEKRMGDSGIGTSESAQYMQDRGFWPKTNPQRVVGKRSPMNKQLLALVTEDSPSREVLAKRVRAIAKTLESRDEDSSYFREVEKHLLGRHEQKDHDPKKKGSHSRSDHKGMRLDAKKERQATRARDKEIEEKAWGQLVREVGEAEAAHLNLDTMNRLKEIEGGLRSKKQVGKHLIGRHEQDDHDPTKKGNRSHKREQHGTAADPGLLSDTQRRMRLNPAAAVMNPLNAASGLTGTTMFFGNNWGRNMPFMDNRQVMGGDMESVATRGVLSGGPIGAGIGAGLGFWSDQRREARGAPGTRTFQNTHRGSGRAKQTQLTKRQKDLIKKYLGVDYLGDDQ